MAVLSNQRHELFSQALAAGETCDEAYQKAGFKPNRGNASTLKANQSILNRVAELQGVAAKHTEITIESLIAEVEAARLKAMAEDRGASAAVAAVAAKAKLAGLWLDRAENVNTNYDISAEPVTDEQWATENVTPH